MFGSCPGIKPRALSFTVAVVEGRGVWDSSFEIPSPIQIPRSPRRCRRENYSPPSEGRPLWMDTCVPRYCICSFVGQAGKWVPVLPTCPHALIYPSRGEPLPDKLLRRCSVGRGSLFGDRGTIILNKIRTSFGEFHSLYNPLNSEFHKLYYPLNNTQK